MDLLCDTCFNRFWADEIPRRGHVCFKCHITTVNLGFTYGKETFHGPTIGELQRKTVSDAAANGYEAVPVTNWG